MSSACFMDYVFLIMTAYPVTTDSFAERADVLRSLGTVFR